MSAQTEIARLNRDKTFIAQVDALAAAREAEIVAEYNTLLSDTKSMATFEYAKKLGAELATLQAIQATLTTAAETAKDAEISALGG